MNARLSTDERREQILRAVTPVIREHGPGASSRLLAEAAGVAEGTIYRAFGDKRSLLLAVLERLSAEAHSLDGVAASSGGTLAGLVARLLDTAAERLGPFLAFAPVLLHELRHIVGEEPSRGHADYLRFVGAIEGLLASHRDELRGDPAAAAAIIGAMALTAAATHGQPDPPLPREHAVDLLLHGIARPSGVPPDG